MSSIYFYHPPTPVAWGELVVYPPRHQRANNAALQTLPLYEPNFTYGRGLDNTFIALKDNFPCRPQLFLSISHRHFEIVKNHGVTKSPAILICRSINGILVNGRYVGNGQQTVLASGDRIAIGIESQKLFKFYDRDQTYPNQDQFEKKIASDYFIIEELGQGGFGSVFKAIEKGTGRMVALKKLRKGFEYAMAKPIDHEIVFMANLNHVCIMRTFGYKETHQHLYISMELMNGGDVVHRIIKRGTGFPENVARCLFYQILSAVHYLHGQNITHRDIKGDNILLFDDNDLTLVKITDFGFAKYVRESSCLKTGLGTPLYSAPEIIQVLNNDIEKYTNKVDIWSLGVVLYTMIRGAMPFSDDYGSPASVQILNGEVHFDQRKWGYLCQVKSMIQKMLTVNPEERPSAVELFDNPWMNPLLPGISDAIGIMNQHAALQF